MGRLRSKDMRLNTTALLDSGCEYLGNFTINVVFIDLLLLHKCLVMFLVNTELIFSGIAFCIEHSDSGMSKQ